MSKPSDTVFTKNASKRLKDRWNPKQKDGHCKVLKRIGCTDLYLCTAYPPEMPSWALESLKSEAAKFTQFTVYNLSTSPYQSPIFPNVIEIPFEDYDLTNLSSLKRCVSEVRQELMKPHNSVILHCKGRPVRTAMITAALVLSLSLGIPTIDKAFEFLADIFPSSFLKPSQLRYLKYFESALSSSLPPMKIPLHLHKIRFNSIPSYRTIGGCEPLFSVKQHGKELYFSKKLKGKSGKKSVEFFCDDIVVSGDIQVTFYHRSLATKIFNVSFSTVYEKLSSDNKLVFAKLQLDKGVKDKKHMSEDFQVEFYFLMPNQLQEMLEDGEVPGRPGDTTAAFEKLAPSFRNSARMATLTDGLTELPRGRTGRPTGIILATSPVPPNTLTPSQPRPRAVSSAQTPSPSSLSPKAPSVLSLSVPSTPPSPSAPGPRRTPRNLGVDFDDLLSDIEKLEVPATTTSTAASVTRSFSSGSSGLGEKKTRTAKTESLESFLEDVFDSSDEKGDTILHNLLAELNVPLKDDDVGMVGCWFCFKNVDKNECVSLGVAMECHKECLKCETCNKSLPPPHASEPQTFIVRDLKIICLNCESDIFPDCYSCCRKITKNPFMLGPHSWHEAHFNCSSCNTNLAHAKGVMQVNEKPMCSKCWKKDTPAISSTKRDKNLEEVLHAVKDLDEGPYFRQYLQGKNCENIFDFCYATENLKKYAPEKALKGEVLIRTKFLSPSSSSTLLGSVIDPAQAQSPLHELQRTAVQAIAQHHNEFCLSSSFMDYLSQIQSTPDEQDVAEALRRQLAEKFIPINVSDLSDQELLIRDKVNKATALRRDTRFALSQGERPPKSKSPRKELPPIPPKSPRPTPTTPPEASPPVKVEVKQAQGPPCARCNSSIFEGEDFITTKGGANIHMSCFYCGTCGESCANQAYLHRDNVLMCGGCVKTKLKRCFKCNGPIMQSSLIVGENHYHTTCLRCSRCGKEIESFFRSGDEFVCEDCNV
eukprot:TRINITY_DN928_c0_g1_i1.p1 TRINITY_DN928_c0_g1~~TRINITY_DN928_c0_g1_i1.p1  ORF type:complete len:986 (-),score=153.12 TRINITY_DN928_c0_g1_i1:97-3054(-)